MNQFILELRQLERSIISFPFICLVDTGSYNNDIVLREVRWRLERGPADLNAGQAALLEAIEKAANPR